ncbi:MAG: oligosaccharide flippase family protein, partial [Chloroherpetonaceae bacterium]|nr:oligosaccharide flippase family protein [Chloroherpetonaceae bacterium]MDW8438819.1 oligosaccharide flippase family protein [Chloroherpetonaceae bacterium]
MALSPAARQTYLLYASQLSQMLFGALTYLVLSNHLSRETFGDRELVIKIVTFTLSFFEFGIFFSGARLLAHQKDKAEETRLMSALVFVGCVICVAYALFLMAIAPLTDALFKTHQSVASVLAMFSFPLSLSLFGFSFFQFLYQGANQILKLSFLNFAIRFAHLASILAWLFFAPLDLTSALALHSLSIASVTGVLIAKAKPSLAAWRAHRGEILTETKRYGRDVFIGHLVGQACANLDAMLLGAFFDSVAVGAYALALFFVAPISAFSEAYSAASFKRLAERSEIPNGVHFANLAGLLALASAYLFAGDWAFRTLFPKYAEKSVLAYPLVAAMVISGLTKPYNAFFRVKGEGKIFNRVALIYALASFVANALLIPFFAETGAA